MKYCQVSIFQYLIHCPGQKLFAIKRIYGLSTQVHKWYSWTRLCVGRAITFSKDGRLIFFEELHYVQ